MPSGMKQSPLNWEVADGPHAISCSHRRWSHRCSHRWVAHRLVGKEALMTVMQLFKALLESIEAGDGDMKVQFLAVGDRNEFYEIDGVAGYRTEGGEDGKKLAVTLW